MFLLLQQYRAGEAGFDDPGLGAEMDPRASFASSVGGGAGASFPSSPNPPPSPLVDLEGPERKQSFKLPESRVARDHGLKPLKLSFDSSGRMSKKDVKQLLGRMADYEVWSLACSGCWC